MISYLEITPFTTDNSVDAPGIESWRGSSCDSNCRSEGYVKPFSYFDSVVKRLPHGISQVVVISGSHKNTRHPEKSLRVPAAP